MSSSLNPPGQGDPRLGKLRFGARAAEREVHHDADPRRRPSAHGAGDLDRGRIDAHRLAAVGDGRRRFLANIGGREVGLQNGMIDIGGQFRNRHLPCRLGGLHLGISLDRSPQARRRPLLGHATSAGPGELTPPGSHASIPQPEPTISSVSRPHSHVWKGTPYRGTTGRRFSTGQSAGWRSNSDGALRFEEADATMSPAQLALAPRSTGFRCRGPVRRRCDPSVAVQWFAMIDQIW